MKKQNMKFAPFDEVDAEVFAGAEGWDNGYKPMITDAVEVNVNGEVAGGQAVLDATGIEIIVTTEDMTVHSWKLPLVTSFIMALGVATSLPVSLTDTMLETLGFEKILE